MYLTLRVTYRDLCLVVLARLDRMLALEDVWRQRLTSVFSEISDRLFDTLSRRQYHVHVVLAMRT